MEKDITPQNSKTEKETKPKSKWKVLISLVFVALALIYDVSPVDIVPDVFPVVGWMDDILVTGLAFFNLIRQIRKKNE